MKERKKEKIENIWLDQSWNAPIKTTLRETYSQRTCHHLESNPRHLMWSASVQPLNYCMVLYATYDHLSAQTVAYSRWLDNVHEGNPGNTMHKIHTTIIDTPVRYVA